MKDSQNSKKPIELKKIGSVKQLLSSYLVAKALVEIREERTRELNAIAKASAPTLNVEDKYMQELFERFSKVINYKEVLMGIAKIGLEDIEKYNFAEDESIKKDATQDTKHLANIFGTNYVLLGKVTLKDHTLRVFEYAIDEAEKKGRSIQIAMPVLGALFHDFGKSSKIRDELIGSEVGKSYRSHASVSKVYIEEKLRTYFTSSESTIEQLEYLVDNHHPSNNRDKNNDNIAFINRADIKARKEEMKKIK